MVFQSKAELPVNTLLFSYVSMTFITTWKCHVAIPSVLSVLLSFDF